MQIIREISMHLDRREPTPFVDAVQGETARAVTLALYQNDADWTIPQDASILIRYRKPDCTGGVYDSMPDGSRAWNIYGSRVDIRIAPQALAVAGVTAMQVAIIAQGEELASFIFHLRVESDPSVGTRASDDYINIGQWLMPRIYQYVSEAEAAASWAAQSAEEARITAAAVSSRYTPSYILGRLDGADGLVQENAGAIVSDYFPLLNHTLGVAFSELVTVRLFYYNQALGFLGADLTRTGSFELDAPEGAAFARAEIRYAAGQDVMDVAALAKYVTLYIPNNAAQDAQRAQDAASQAYHSADRANTASVTAEASKTAAMQHAADAHSYALRAENAADRAEAAAGDGVPDYWNAHLTEKAAAIRGEMDAIGNAGVSFLAVTDRHEGSNAGHTAALIRAVEEKTGLLVADLGDCASSGVHPDKAHLLATLDSVMDGYHGLNVLRHRGNHDASYGSLGGVSYAYNLSNAEAYSRIFSQLPTGCVTGGDGQYYYYDDPRSKTRFICLNTVDHPYEENADGTAKYNGQDFYSIRQAQMDFLVSALNVEAGWHIIVTTHVPPVGAYDAKFPTAPYLRKLLAAYNSKTAFSADYAGQFGGELQYTDLAKHNDSEWQSGVRVNSSNAVVSISDANQILTNPIPVGGDNQFHVKGLNVYDASCADGANYCRLVLLDANKAIVAACQLNASAWKSYYCTADYDSAVAVVDVAGAIEKAKSAMGVSDVSYVRFCGYTTAPADVIVTRDQQIIQGEAGWDALTINADFSGCKGELVGMFTGHMHRDLNYNSGNCPDINFPIVTVGRDAILNEANYTLERTVGTVTEHTFDAVTVDYTKRLIRTVRIGAGADREIAY